MPYPAVFKQRLLRWLQEFTCVAFLDSNNHKHDAYSTHDCIAGCADALVETGNKPFADIAVVSNSGRHLFGFFGYDVKNKIEQLQSEKPGRTGFPDVCFFAADTVVELKDTEARITTSGNAISIFESISNVNLDDDPVEPHVNVEPEHRTTKKKYIETVNALRKHIEDGDFYELNYCQEFFCEAVDIDPLLLFERMNKRTAAPFAAFMKFNHLFMLSASPERFLKRVGGTLVSQPIKGTAPRDLSDANRDASLKQALRESEKEKAENVMIVDLVRNDLNRVCVSGSVKVDELFGVYSFPTVHHIISTVTGTLRPDATFDQIMNATFPAGSMTGAPKVEVMKAIEFYEYTARGAYAGCTGYIAPNGDFDFNVVIRTLLWNGLTRYLSFHTGGAVTFDSEAEAEYDECMLKARALKEVLRG